VVRAISRRIFWIACVCACVLLRDRAQAGTSPDSPFTVGVLRRDAVIVPFARFDGKHWHQVWPQPQDNPEVPVDIRNVPKRWWGAGGTASTWLASITGRTPVTLHVRQPDLIRAYCLRQVGLRTDYAPAEPVPPFDEHPYPKDGLAVTPPRDVEPVQILDPESAELGLIRPFVTRAFNNIEREIEGHPVQRKMREATDPRIEAGYSYGDRPRYYYVEAVREYRTDPNGDDCRAAAVGHAWIVRDGGPLTVLTSYVVVQDCARSSMRYMNPLGIIRAGGKLFWVAQFAGWDDEYYHVIALTPRAVETAFIRLGGQC
jgi:hypothetical protein